MTAAAAPRERTEPSPGRLRSRLITAFLLAPAAIWYAVMLVLPLAIVVVFSFGRRAKNGGYEPAFILDNYIRAIEKSDPFVTSLQMAIAGTIGCLLVGLPLAYFLATQHNRTANGDQVNFEIDCRYFETVVGRLHRSRRIGQ